jgi:hypothetical protein
MHLPGLDPGIDRPSMADVRGIITEGAAWRPGLTVAVESQDSIFDPFLLIRSKCGIKFPAVAN